MTDTHPLTIAREVVRQHGHLDRDALSRREKERLDLARAVFRVEALADRLERESTFIDLGGEWSDSFLATIASDIREALDGDT